mgnify:CR=1 FL=1
MVFELFTFAWYNYKIFLLTYIESLSIFKIRHHNFDTCPKIYINDDISYLNTVQIDVFARLDFKGLDGLIIHSLSLITKPI